MEWNSGMAIGLAAILIFGLFLIDKHGLWRRAVKIVAGLVVLAMLGFGCLLGYAQYDEYHTKAEATRQAAIEMKVAADAQAHICKIWEINHPLGSPMERVGSKEDGEVLYPPAGCEGPLENAYQTTITNTLLESAARQASEAMSQRAAKLKSKKEAEANAQKIVDANAKSVFWTYGASSLNHKLWCYAHPNIEIGEIDGTSGVYMAAAANRLGATFFSMGVARDGSTILKNHVTIDLAKQDVLQHAHYELCTQ